VEVDVEVEYRSRSAKWEVVKSSNSKMISDNWVMQERSLMTVYGQKDCAQVNF